MSAVESVAAAVAQTVMPSMEDVNFESSMTTVNSTTTAVPPSAPDIDATSDSTLAMESAHNNDVAPEGPYRQPVNDSVDANVIVVHDGEEKEEKQGDCQPTITDANDGEEEGDHHEASVATTHDPSVHTQTRAQCRPCG